MKERFELVKMPTEKARKVSEIIKKMETVKSVSILKAKYKNVEYIGESRVIVYFEFSRSQFDVFDKNLEDIQDIQYKPI